MKQFNNDSHPFICLVGPIAAGKGVVVEYLTELGYTSFSLSTIVREETERRSLPIERKILQDVGDSLRNEFGNDILAKRTVKNIKTNNIQKALIDGARNPAEVLYLKKELNAYIIGITADADTRFKRVLSRKKESDPISRGLFEIMDARDLGIGQLESGNNVGECLKLADVIIENNGTREEFVEKIKNIF